MREHPIPQDITNYRFHIIGSMTLRQFLEIASGFVVAAILYKTNLIGIIKWPLIGISIGVGAAMAFLPIEERPLDHWIVTFIRVLYKPTQFFWKRVPMIPKAFNYTPTNTTALEPEIDLSPVRRQRIKEYIGSVSHATSEPFALTDEEQARVSGILATFTTQPVTTTQTTTLEQTPAEKPDLEVRVRKLRPQHNPEIVLYSSNETVTTVQQPTHPPTTQDSTTPSQPDVVSTQLPVTAAAVEVLQPLPSHTTESSFIATNQHLDETTQQPIATTTTTNTTQVDVSQVTRTTSTQTNEAVSYNTDLPFPSTPTETNKVVGMVLTPENDLISDAIVEIRTMDGAVARAVKTNALGQFFITTPLASGEYTIVVEKDNFNFPSLQLMLQNQIVQPIEIRSV